MQDHELDTYLGDFADRVDDDRKRILKEMLEKLDQRWPRPDFTDEQLEAGNAAAEMTFGDTTAEQIAVDYQAARDAERVARLRLTGAIVITSLSEPSLSELALAGRFGVTRMTVRKALGKK
jgi:hypothetical protein